MQQKMKIPLWRQTKDNQDNEDDKQDLNVSINMFVNNPTNIIKTFDLSRYQYSKEEIEEFFSSNMGQQKEHTLEESICRP